MLRVDKFAGHGRAEHEYGAAVEAGVSVINAQLEQAFSFGLESLQAARAQRIPMVEIDGIKRKTE